MGVNGGQTFLLKAVQATSKKKKNLIMQPQRYMEEKVELESVKYIAIDAMLELRRADDEDIKFSRFILPRLAVMDLVNAVIARIVAITKDMKSLKGIIIVFDGYGLEAGEEAGTKAKMMEHRRRYDTDDETKLQIQELLDEIKMSGGNPTKHQTEQIKSLVKSLGGITYLFKKDFFCQFLPALEETFTQTEPKARVLFSPNEGEALVKFLGDHGAWTMSADYDMMLFGAIKCYQTYGFKPTTYALSEDIFKQDFRASAFKTKTGMFQDFNMFNNLPLICFSVLMGTDFFMFNDFKIFPKVKAKVLLPLIQDWINESRHLESNDDAFKSIVSTITTCKYWTDACKRNSLESDKEMITQFENALLFYYYCPVLTFTSTIDPLRSGHDLLDDIINKFVSIENGYVNAPIHRFVSIDNLESREWFTAPSFNRERVYGERFLANGFNELSGWHLPQNIDRFLAFAPDGYLSKLALVNKDYLSGFVIRDGTDRSDIVFNLKKMITNTSPDTTFDYIPNPVTLEFPDNSIASSDEMFSAIRSKSFELKENVLNLLVNTENGEIKASFNLPFFSRCTLKTSDTYITRVMRLAIEGNVDISNLTLRNAIESETNSEVVSISSKVIASMRTEMYSCRIIFSKEGQFKSNWSSCDCTVGLSTCAHQIATLFYIGLILHSRDFDFEEENSAINLFPQDIFIAQKIYTPIRLEKFQKEERNKKKKKKEEEEEEDDGEILDSEETVSKKKVSRRNFEGDLLAKLSQIIFDDKHITGFPEIIIRKKDDHNKQNRKLFTSNEEKGKVIKLQDYLIACLAKKGIVQKHPIS
jgi:hypothetical protein